MRRHASSLGGEFDRFWLAAASSNLGDGVRLGALPLLALTLTTDARLIALVSAATTLPWLLVGPFGGAIVDRTDRRRLMIGGQLGRAVLAAGLTLSIATDTASISIVIGVAFALGVGEVVVDSASQAAIPMLVEPGQLDRANGRLIAAITVLDQVVGVMLGAVLFAVATELPFAIDAATFLVGSFLLATIRRPFQQDRVPTGTVRRDITEGMRFLFRHRFLRTIMAGVAVSNLAGNISFAVLVVLVVDEIGAAEASYGVVLGIGAVGGVLGSLVAGRLSQRFGRRRVLVGLPIVLVLTHLTNSVATSPWIVSAAFFASSFAIVCFNVPGQSLRQLVTPEHLMGRVVASFRMFGMGAAPVGAVVGGLVTEAFGVRVANVTAAAVAAVAWFLLVAAVRHLDESTAANPPVENPQSG